MLAAVVIFGKILVDLLVGSGVDTVISDQIILNGRDLSLGDVDILKHLDVDAVGRERRVERGLASRLLDLGVDSAVDLIQLIVPQREPVFVKESEQNRVLHYLRDRHRAEIVADSDGVGHL